MFAVPFPSRLFFGAEALTGRHLPRKRAAVPPLRNLTKLEMSVNGGAVRRSTAGCTTHVDENGTTHIIHPQIFSSPWGPPAEADQADTLLLQTTASLPALRSLTISAVEAEHHRGLLSGLLLDHVGAVNAAIVNAVEAFRTDVPCATVVCADGSTYELREVGGPGEAEEGRSQFEREWGYKRVSRTDWNSATATFSRALYF
ncbi:hypothetical protein C8R45DRAFT_933514 [Mycena sanguinolenta]|nr:hypothetical protein C8R45DRAFT_933514 [Mycena sanguinolenta]